MWSLSLLAINQARNVHPHANASEWGCKLFPVGMQFIARAGIPCTQQGVCGWQCDRRECMTCTRHNSAAHCAESLSTLIPSSYSRATVNNWEKDLTFQAAQGYDDKELEVIHMHRTVRPSHTFCYQLSNTKLLSASKSCSWGNLTTAARNVLSTSPFPPGTCESWHRGVRGQKQNAKRVCINNEAMCAWSCMVTS